MKNALQNLFYVFLQTTHTHYKLISDYLWMDVFIRTPKMKWQSVIEPFIIYPYAKRLTPATVAMFAR